MAEIQIGPSAAQGSTTSHLPGKRTMKEYPVTEETLDIIGTLKGSSSFFFALGSLTLGFSLSTFQSLSLAGEGVSPTLQATWNAYLASGCIATAISYTLGVVYLLKGKSAVDKIKEETAHE